jgi:uncharacterized protein (TIGR00730 family)
VKSIEKNEEQLFLQGPRSRWSEFVFAIKVLVEFIRGFRKFHFLGPCVTFFGSARFNEKHPFYETTKTLGKKIAGMGFTVMTGGGPGLMEAANRGARENGGISVGCNIALPAEQHPNKYLDKWVEMNYFFVRKVLLSKYSYAFIVMPGGYGTLDEFFESLTLIQTHKTQNFPVVLMGKSFHAELMAHIEAMEKSKTISPADRKLFLFTDDIDEAITHIKINAIEKFNLQKTKTYKPLRIFGEKKLWPVQNEKKTQKQPR